MPAVYLRQAIFGVLLILMGAVVWVTVWSNQVEAQVRFGLSQPLPGNAALFSSDDAPTTRP